ncbi:hypothetical protein PTQ19_10305 [Microbacterium esteraromaticum]|uniref:hypothetical protein n=1 Tax=Microbacterium esteraromaticum TaxID=57043 RepID=UPI00236803C4|nr:hypothetical protein [Microbacterium esteraromaticum]WDH77913.1 hypothetical protein PTQ19_10305 [Microbacterium esteraromaticum]
MRNRSIAQYIGGGIAAAEGFANLASGTGFSGRRTGTRRAASARAGRSSGS